MIGLLSRRDVLLRIAALLVLPSAQQLVERDETTTLDELGPIVDRIGKKALRVLGRRHAHLEKVLGLIRLIDSPIALAERIEADIIEDFNADEIIVVDGWFFSKTEAAFYAALFSLKQSPQNKI